MPPRSLPGRARRRTVVVGTVIAVLVSVAVVWSVVRFAADNPERANLGDSVFRVGRADRLARAVAAGGPALFQDPLARGRGRNLYLQHQGGDPDKGWVAVEARLPDEAGCAVTWDRTAAAFVDCRGGRHGAEGTGLVTYRATVEDGVLSVDLRTATSASTASTTAPAP